MLVDARDGDWRTWNMVVTFGIFETFEQKQSKLKPRTTVSGRCGWDDNRCILRRRKMMYRHCHQSHELCTKICINRLTFKTDAFSSAIIVFVARAHLA